MNLPHSPNNSSYKIDYIPVETKKDTNGTDRLSARYYYDTYGHDRTIGDRCDIRNNGEYKCLLLSSGSPKWMAKTKIYSEKQAPCEDFSPKCKHPKFE